MTATTLNVWFQKDTCSAVLGEAKELIQEHWRESSAFPELPANPDYGRLLQAEEAGMLWTFTMRGQAGGICGYAVFFISPSLHYFPRLQAVCDALYVDPEFRGKSLDFLRYLMAYLRTEKVELVFMASKMRADWGIVLDHLGFRETDKIFGKIL